MKKQGISTLVATVLIILITVAAVAIIWVAVVPMINENIEFGELDGRVSVLSSGGYTVYDADEGIAIVQVKRDVDEGVMNRIRILFLIEGNSYSSTVVAPGSGQTKTYTFDLSDYGEPESVSVAPIFVSSSGREKEGSVTSRADFVLGEIDDVDADVYDLERDYFYEMPMTGLVSWWKFDGYVNDSVGGNDGEIYGDANLDGGVLNLDGDGDYVKITNDLSLSPSSISIIAWFKRLDYEFGTVVNKPGSYWIRLEGDDNKTMTRYVFSDSSQSSEIQTPETITDFDWHMVVSTFNEDSGKINLYLDGDLRNSVTYSGKILNSSLNSLYIGYSGGTFNGSIDNVMIFNRALSEDEIIAIYNVQK